MKGGGAKKQGGVLSKAAPAAAAAAAPTSKQQQQQQQQQPSKGGGRAAAAAASDEEEDEGEEEDEEDEEEGSEDEHHFASAGSSAVVLEGWVTKRPPTKLGAWQNRWLVLSGGVLYFYETQEAASREEDSFNLPVTDIKVCAPLVGPGSRSTDKKDLKAFLIDGDALRCNSVEDMAQWVAVLSKERAKYARSSSSGGGGKGKAGGGGGAEDSDADSDDSEYARVRAATGGAAPLGAPPKWFKDYEKKSEKAQHAQWAPATSRLTTLYFAPVAAGAAEGGGGSSGGSSASASSSAQRAKTIEALLSATSAAAAALQERCAEARRRGRFDVVRHFVRNFDTAFCMVLSNLTAGNEPAKLSPKALLQLLDCVEGYMSARASALGAQALDEGESAAAEEVEAARTLLAERYLTVSQGLVHQIVTATLTKLQSESRIDLVEPHIGSRLGTQCPTDLFNLLSKHLSDARRGCSKSLCRALLSMTMAEVSGFAQSVLVDALEQREEEVRASKAGKGPAEGSDDAVEYMTAVVNDSGLLLDHMEQLECEWGRGGGCRRAQPVCAPPTHPSALSLSLSLTHTPRT